MSSVPDVVQNHVRTDDGLCRFCTSVGVGHNGGPVPWLCGAGAAVLQQAALRATRKARYASGRLAEVK